MKAQTALLAAAMTVILSSCSQPRQEGVSDAEMLKTALLPRAVDALKINKDFVALEGAVQTDGTMVEVPPGASAAGPRRQELIDSLIYGCRVKAKSGSIRACAIVIRSGPIPQRGVKQDALWFDFDSRSGTAMALVYPYSVSKGQIDLSKPIEKEGAGAIWGHGKWE